MDTNTDTEAAARQTGQLLVRLLTGGGVPASWARIIIGALMGAALAIIGMSQTSCSLSYSQRAEAGGTTRTTLKTSLTLPLPEAESN